MPALRLSPELPLTEEDKALGVTVRIKILPPDAERTAMGLIADTFRGLPDTFTGQDTVSSAAFEIDAYRSGKCVGLWLITE